MTDPRSGATFCNLHAQNQTPIKSSTETLGQLDSLFVAQQPHHISHAVIHGRAVAAALKVIFNLYSQLRREIAFLVIGQLPPNLIAVDLYSA